MNAITKEQLTTFEKEGYLLIPEVFSAVEIDILKAELPKIFAEDTERKISETKKEIVRSIYGIHNSNPTFNRFSQNSRLVLPAMQIVDSDVYIYQSKINAKASFDGDVWNWHQDYIFWLKEDGLLSPRVVNAVILLDEMNEFNGPIYVIPQSYKEGTMQSLAQDRQIINQVKSFEAYSGKPEWITNLTADLKYSISKDEITRLISIYGISSIKGPRGSVLFFHPNTVHASPGNISPFNRSILIITFNSVENIPQCRTNPRPDFLSSQHYGSIKPIDEDPFIISTR